MEKRAIASVQRHVRLGWIATLGVVAFVIQIAVAQQVQQGAADHWVGTWATALVARTQPTQSQGQAPSPTTGRGRPAPLQLNNQTLRQIVHISIGGSRARVVLSNAFGTAPLTIGAAHIALRYEPKDPRVAWVPDAAIAAASDRALTFSGQAAIAIPAGGMMYSDPVNLALQSSSDVAVDLYLPGDTNVPSPLAFHGTALQTSYVSEAGNHVGETTLPVSATMQNWFVLSRVEVTAPAIGAVVTFGASLTDGVGSTANANNRWPNDLARRLLAQPAPLAVMDEGISGNRLVGDGASQAGLSALARFDRDVLDQTGVTHVIVADMALNDIGNARENPTPTANDLIAGMKQLIVRAHARSLKIYGATLTPFEGANYFTEVGEVKRQAVNQWIRTAKEYDAVIDFDSATRDPNHPARFIPQYDSGDHLHPNDTGYHAMADAIDLALFKTTATSRTSSR